LNAKETENLNWGQEREEVQQPQTYYFEEMGRHRVWKCGMVDEEDLCRIVVGIFQIRMGDECERERSL
jgi:hypothetical protein